jgi:hypothetical protein
MVSYANNWHRSDVQRAHLEELNQTRWEVKHRNSTQGQCLNQT